MLTAMCGRFALRAPRQALNETFGLDRVPRVPARHNIAPGQLVEAVAAEASGRRHMRLFRWGLAPSWSKDPAQGARLINARSETALDKPAFRAAMRYRRCLVPADGFYEWQALARGKRPWFFEPEEGGLLALVGIWEAWQVQGGEVLETCAVLTREAQGRVAEIHERMPVIVPPGLFNDWLSSNLQDSRGIAALLESCVPTRAAVLARGPGGEQPPPRRPGVLPTPGARRLGHA